MKKRILILSAIVLCFGMGIFLYFYFRSENDKGILRIYGNVDVRQVQISFRVAGQVEKLFFQEGDFVEAGSLMAVLDHTPYISQVNEAKAKLESIRINFEHAKTLLKRREELIINGGVSQEDLDDALSNRNSLEADFEAAKASLAVSEDNLRYTQVFAPTDGILLTRIREEGTVINPADPIYTLSICSPIWVRTYVSEPDLGRIAYGMEAKVYTDTKGGQVYSGQIGFISPIAEFTPKTVETTRLRTDLVYRLRVYVENPDYLLKQGMPVTVKIDTRTHHESANRCSGQGK